MFSPSVSQQASIEKEKRTFNLSNSESMSLHVFERRFSFDARLGRLEEPLITDCGFTRVGTVTFCSTVPISSQEGLGWYMPQKCAPALHNLLYKSPFLASSETRLRITFA